jgi:hypothetical protein
VGRLEVECIVRPVDAEAGGLLGTRKVGALDDAREIDRAVAEFTVGLPAVPPIITDAVLLALACGAADGS